MASWQKGLAGAAAAKSERWANSMATNARKRASALEDAAAKTRTEGWRKSLGATSEKATACSPLAKALTDGSRVSRAGRLPPADAQGRMTPFLTTMATRTKSSGAAAPTTSTYLSTQSMLSP